MDSRTVSDLAAYILSERVIEKEAAKRRKVAEEKLLSMMEKTEEGTVSCTTEDGFKIVVTHKLTRKVDVPLLKFEWQNLTALVQSAFKWVAEIDLKTVRAIEKTNPYEYLNLDKFIVIAPAAPTIKIEKE